MAAGFKRIYTNPKKNRAILFWTLWTSKRNSADTMIRLSIAMVNHTSCRWHTRLKDEILRSAKHHLTDDGPTARLKSGCVICWIKNRLYLKFQGLYHSSHLWQISKTRLHDKIRVIIFVTLIIILTNEMYRNHSSSRAFLFSKFVNQPLSKFPVSLSSRIS